MRGGGSKKCCHLTRLRECINNEYWANLLFAATPLEGETKHGVEPCCGCQWNVNCQRIFAPTARQMYADSVERKQKESASVRWLRRRRRTSSTSATKHPSCRQPFLQVATYIIRPIILPCTVPGRSCSLRLSHGFDSQYRVRQSEPLWRLQTFTCA